MGPRISAKFRRRNGIPYAIEQFGGKQFRCRHCNEVFWQEKQLDRHLEQTNKAKRSEIVRVDPDTPELNGLMELKIGYFYDISDSLKRKYLKLRKDEIYDGIVLNAHTKKKETSDEH